MTPIPGHAPWCQAPHWGECPPEGEHGEPWKLVARFRAALREIAGGDVSRSSAVRIAQDALGNNQEEVRDA